MAKDFSGWFFRGIYILRLKTNLKFCTFFYRTYVRAKGVRVGKGTRFYGFPRIFRVPGSKISLGKNCLINSAWNSVEIGLSRRTALVTLGPEAEIELGDNVGASGAVIAAMSKVSIGDNVMVGAFTTIADTDFHNPNPYSREERVPARPVVIEENVFLGMNCTILKGVHIGKNAVIGANSVVVGNIPENAVAMGNPCKMILRRNWGGQNE